MQRSQVDNSKKGELYAHKRYHEKGSRIGGS